MDTLEILFKWQLHFSTGNKTWYR